MLSQKLHKRPLVSNRLLPDVVTMSRCVQCRRARNGLESWFKRGVIGQRLKRLFCAPESSLEVTTEASNVKLVPKRSSAKDLQTRLAESLAKEHFRRGRRGRLRPRNMHLQPPDAGAAGVATIQGNAFWTKTPLQSMQKQLLPFCLDCNLKRFRMIPKAVLETFKSIIATHRFRQIIACICCKNVVYLRA